MKFYKKACLVLAYLSLIALSSAGALSTEPGKKDQITVLPVKNLRKDFLMGVDISSMISVEEAGGIFYDADGNPADLLDLLKAGGANCVRIRVWNNPFDPQGRSYGAGTCDIETAVKIGKRATASGFGVLIDFHYSDFWADPSKQTAPKAWQRFSLEQKAKALSEFTTKSLERLRSEGVKVTMVQVGNEINNGMSGETQEDAICVLLKAGCDAVRAFDSSVKIVIHFTDPTSEGYLEGKAFMLESHGVDYDVMAASFYPYWHGDAQTLADVLKSFLALYDKEVMVAEISYPFTDMDGDGYPNVVSTNAENQEFRYPLSVEGQAVAVRDAIAAVASVKKGIGVFYWEPAWIPVAHWDSESPDAQKVLDLNREAWEKYGCGWASSAAVDYDKELQDHYNGGTWDNQAFFDFDGKCLASINVFNYARKGSKGELRVLRPENTSIEFSYGKQEVLPKTMKVLYNDGSKRDMEVEWNKEDATTVLENPTFGEYVVRGVLKNGMDIVCNVTVLSSNFLVNGDFETGDLTGWTVDNPVGKGWPKVEKNRQNAKEGVCYFTAWEADNFDFVLSQSVQGLRAGKYTCFANFEGTGIKNPSGTQLKVIVTKKDGSTTEGICDVTIPNVWKKFFRAEVPVIVDSDAESVTVSVRVKAEFDPVTGTNGAWLVMDDVSLFFVE